METVRLLGNGAFAREVESYLRGHVRHVSLVDSRYAAVDDPTPTLIAIGNPLLRQHIAQQYWRANFIRWDPLAFVDGNQISQGVIICPGVWVTVNVRLYEHVILNLNCTVGHDCILGACTTVAPGANISGHCTLGQRCYIGTGAVLREEITLTDDVVIGAGGVVVKDILEPGTYVGNPVRRIK
jgi:sugar O-acyltransferase (sialic acid O-acetyltransferase NeuD family)